MCAMEDVLEVYQRPYGDNEVLVCLDETSKQQVKETRLPRPPRPGPAGSFDYEYEMQGLGDGVTDAPELCQGTKVSCCQARPRCIPSRSLLTVALVAASGLSPV